MYKLMTHSLDWLLFGIVWYYGLILCTMCKHMDGKLQFVIAFAVEVVFIVESVFSRRLLAKWSRSSVSHLQHYLKRV